MRALSPSTPRGATPLWPVSRDRLAAWLDGEGGAHAAWVRSAGFDAAPGTLLPLPGTSGTDAVVGGVLLGVPEEPDLWAYGGCARALPPATYRIAGELEPRAANAAAIGWGLGDYRFDRYRSAGGADAARDEAVAVLALPKTGDWHEVKRIVESVALVRDLVNTPAEHMGPAELAAATRELADAYGGACTTIAGEALLERDLPAIHAVGRASARPPCLIDLTWGDAGAPKVTLVGKGVCFDSGGLDLKNATGMRLMKKDMGGAANLLGLARLIMDAALPVRLRVLIPAVENAVAGNAMRPGDVLATRKGLTIEIGNTDAEGRVVLADALALADEERPDLLIDCATLTGAARVALGPDLPAMYTPSDELAAQLAHHAAAASDPLWRMPLWQPYRELIDSDIADIANAGDSPFAGSVTAALFLKDFVTTTANWVHLDLYAWNRKARPGRPAGGEAQAIRALYGLVKERHG